MGVVFIMRCWFMFVAWLVCVLCYCFGLFCVFVGIGCFVVLLFVFWWFYVDLIVSLGVLVCLVSFCCLV